MFMSKVFPRHCKANPPLAIKGDGVYIMDQQGKHYLDASGGAAVSCLGHGNSRVIEAIKQQLDQLEFAHTGFFSSEAAEALASLLIDKAPGALDRVYLVSGGSEAVEAAIKLARQYFIETGQPQRHRVIAPVRHGRDNRHHADLASARHENGRARRPGVDMTAEHMHPPVP